MKSNTQWIHDIAVIGFDLDGTLYPKDAIPKHIIYERMISAVSRSRSWDEAKARNEFEKVLKQVGSHTKALRVFGVNGERFFEDAWDSVPLSKYIKKDAGISEAVQKLSEHFRLFVLSNSNRVDQIRYKLSLVGIGAEVFQAILSTIDIGAVKPDPEPYEAAMRVMKFQPQQVLYVGDRVSTDIKGAKGVNMRACLVGGTSHLADMSVKDMVELCHKLI